VGPPVTPAEIWKKLTPSQRVTLLEETHPNIRYGDLYKYGDDALVRAGLKRRGHVTADQSSGSARHALGRKGLLEIGQTISMPTSAAGFHTPRKPTALGRSVADHGVSLLASAEHGGSTMKTSAVMKAPTIKAGQTVTYKIGIGNLTNTGRVVSIGPSGTTIDIAGPGPSRGLGTHGTIQFGGGGVTTILASDVVRVHSSRKAHSRKKKQAAAAPVANPIDTVRRLMRSSGFDEEEVYGGAENQIHFASREEGDVLEGRADPGTVRFAREKAKEIETAVPGAKARVEVVDEWVSIAVTLPGGVPPPAKAPAETRPLPEWAQRLKGKEPKYLQPGDEVKYTNFTVGGSYEGKAVVTWDHGKSVEARTLPAGEKIRLERAADGSLRRFT